MKETMLGKPKINSFKVDGRRGTEETAKIVGQRVAYLRAKKEMTQQQLADRYKISKNAVSNYERGVIVPPLNVIFDIADGLNLSLDEFFGFAPPKQHTIEEEVLLNYFNNTDPKARELIIETARTTSKIFPAEKEE